MIADAMVEADEAAKAVGLKFPQVNEHFYASIAERDKAMRLQERKRAERRDLAEEPVLVTGQPTVIGKQYPDLHYSWAHAQAHTYAFQLKADVRGRAYAFHGSCQLETGPTWDELVAQGLPTPPEAVSEPSRGAPTIVDRLTKNINAEGDLLAQKFTEKRAWDGTGSAFVIAADGWLATCAHVVEDADKVQVTLEGKEHTAQVKVIDFKHDLALLKINAKGLKPLRIAPADTIQLGDEVRVVGFPLAELLKSRLSVTRGTISIQPTGEEGDALQIDAAVNPGNSGGPVIDALGQLIGVATSKLVHEAVTGVSFATPADQVARLAKKHKIVVDRGSSDASRAGGETLKQVARSVGLVRVRLPAEKRSRGTKLRYTTELSASAAASQGLAWYDGRYSRVSSCSPDAFGHLEEPPEGARLPFLLLHPAELVIEQLDRRGRDSWVVDRVFNIDLASEGLPRSGGRKTDILMPPHGSLLYSIDSRGASSITLTGGRHDAREPITLSLRALHKVVEREDNRITVGKRVEIVATLPEDRPAFEMSGTGGYVFDLSENNVRETMLRLECEWLRSKNKASFPVEFYAKRIGKDEEVVRHSVKNIKGRLRTAEEKKNQLRILANRTSQAALSDCITTLASKDSKVSEISKSLNQLSRFPVESKRQEEVTGILRRLAVSHNGILGSHACKLLAKWGGKSQSSFLIERLRRCSGPYGRDIIEALGECGDPAAAQPILDYVQGADSWVHRTASQALANLGPEVEALVIPLLKRIDSDQREMACDILSRVGTEECLPAIDELIASTGARDRMRAEWAKRAVERRLASGGGPEKTRGKTRGAIKKFPAISPSSQAESAVVSLDAHKEVHPSLVKLSKSPVIDRIRGQAAKAIARYLDADVPGPITLAAVQAIGVWGDERHSPALVELLGLVKTDEARESLFTALSRVGDEEAAEAIRPYLADKTLRFRAATALRRISAKTQAEYIRRLEDADVFQRAIAAEVLGRAGDANAKRAIEEQIQKEGVGSLAYHRCLVALARLELRLADR